LDWATKLRQTRRPDAAPVTLGDVGHYAVQSPDGTIAADGFPDREAAQEYADYLRPDDGSSLLYADSFADGLSKEEGDNLTEDEWCMAFVDANGTEGIRNPSSRFTELKALTIVFKYPLTKEARLEFKSETGFTRSEIIECIRAGYRKIYAEDAGECAPDLPCWMAAPGSKWGIWGHSIGDLVIEGMDVNTDTGIVELWIGS
jgi:hypothetical protein